jgi:hypothetical protein
MFQASAEGAILDHQFRVAAYVVTWVVQFGYVVWLAMKWRAQKREAAPRNKPPQDAAVDN